jgi:hypothetical protein
LVTGASRDARLTHVAELAEIARADLRRRNKERRALGIIQRQIAAPIAMLREHLDFSGHKLGDALSADLALCDPGPSA